MKRLGNRTDPSLRAQALLEINVVIDELENGPFLPWFLETETVALNTVADQITVPLPADFLLEIEEGRFRLQNGTGTFKILDKMSLEELRDEFVNADSGFPSAYAIHGTNIHLGATPDAIYEIKWPYYRNTSDIADSTTPDVFWLGEAFNWICYKTAADLSDFIVINQKVADRLAKRANASRSLVWKKHGAREHVNKKYVVE